MLRTKEDLWSNINTVRLAFDKLGIKTSFFLKHKQVKQITARYRRTEYINNALCTHSQNIFAVMVSKYLTGVRRVKFSLQLLTIFISLVNRKSILIPDYL